MGNEVIYTFSIAHTNILSNYCVVSVIIWKQFSLPAVASPLPCSDRAFADVRDSWCAAADPRAHADWVVCFAAVDERVPTRSGRCPYLSLPSHLLQPRPDSQGAWLQRAPEAPQSDAPIHCQWATSRRVVLLSVRWSQLFVFLLECKTVCLSKTRNVIFVNVKDTQLA